jgi:hypothetical protein
MAPLDFVNSSGPLPMSLRYQSLTIKMRVVLVSGGVFSGVGKDEFLALLDIFPVVSLSRWAAICDDANHPDFLDHLTDLGPFRHYRYSTL